MLGEIVIYVDSATREYPALITAYHREAADLVVFTPTGIDHVLDVSKGDGANHFRHREVRYRPSPHASPRPTAARYGAVLTECLGTERMEAANLTEEMLTEWFDLAIRGVAP